MRTRGSQLLRNLSVSVRIVVLTTLYQFNLFAWHMIHLLQHNLSKPRQKSLSQHTGSNHTLSTVSPRQKRHHTPHNLKTVDQSCIVGSVFVTSACASVSKLGM